MLNLVLGVLFERLFGHEGLTSLAMGDVPEGPQGKKADLRVPRARTKSAREEINPKILANGRQAVNLEGKFVFCKHKDSMNQL